MQRIFAPNFLCLFTTHLFTIVYNFLHLFLNILRSGAATQLMFDFRYSQLTNCSLAKLKNKNCCMSLTDQALND